MEFQTIYLFALFGAIALLVIAYAIRVVLKGRAHYSRVDKQGSSTLLGKNVMEMAYWGMQPVAKLLVFCRITPNKLSWSSLAFGFLAALCLSVGHFGFGAIFAGISALLDALDGMVARLTGVSSDAGEVLDAAVDRYVEFMFLAGLVIYYREIVALQVLALVALLGSFMVSYSTAKAEALSIKPPKGNMRRPERAVYLSFGAALSPFTIFWFETPRDYAIAIGHPMVMALCLVAFFANVSAVERLIAIAKTIKLRERSAAALKAKDIEKSLGQEDESEDVHEPVSR